MPENTLFIFDFDNTIVTENTDLLPFEKLHPPTLDTHIYNEELRQKLGWTALINEALIHLSTRGITPRHIINAASEAHLPPSTASALRALHKSPYAKAAIASDANTKYIDAVLDRNYVQRDTFDAGVYTNIAHEIEGVLKVHPYVSESLPHACEDCPKNMCKGEIVRRLAEEHEGWRLVYVGDGGNDFCGAKAVSPGGVVLVRQGYRLEKLVEKTGLRHDVKSVSWVPEDLGGLLENYLR